MELPEEKIKKRGAELFSTPWVKVGYRMALANCGCHECTEIFARIEFGEMRQNTGKASLKSYHFEMTTLLSVKKLTVSIWA